MENLKEKILIVAGREVDRTLLSKYLQEANYQVLTAADGQQGLQCVQAEKPEVVVLDLHLTDLEAQAFIRTLAADEDLTVIPIILLANADEREIIQQCLEAGADDYLVRPVSPTMLKTQVKEFQAIRQRRLEVRAQARARLREHLEHDVEIARDIQRSFLPSELPQPEGWEIAACFQPAREVAGDFYDAFLMAQGRRVGLVIADVCDKGVSAALFMALIRSMTRAFAQQNYSLNLMDAVDVNLAGSARARRSMPSVGAMSMLNAVSLTNSYIAANHLELNYFATLFFGMIDPATGNLAYINAGHCPPLVLGPDGSLKHTLAATGTPVGMLPDASYEIKQVTLEPGDILFSYSDGVTDARNPAGKMFTEKRMQDLLSRLTGPAADLLKGLQQALREHIADADPYDDITMLAARRIP